jgi:hypothetical protein
MNDLTAGGSYIFGKNHNRQGYYECNDIENTIELWLEEVNNECHYRDNTQTADHPNKGQRKMAMFID